MNIGRMLANAARRLPDAPAVTFGERRMTYAELDRRTDALAHGLGELGVQPGDRVGLLMQNRPEMIESMQACFKAGFCVVPLNAKLTGDEIDFHLDDSGAKALLADGQGAEAAASCDLDRTALVVAGAEPSVAGAHAYEDVVADGSGRGSVTAPVDRDHLAWLFYTSGTTGRPKGAMLTHGALAFVTASWLADLTPLDENDVTLHAAPLSHGAGFHSLAAVARGAHQVIPAQGRFDPMATLRLLEDARVTNTWLVPTQIVMLADALAASGLRAPTALRWVVYGGAPIAPAELRRAMELFGPVFVQLYGQGETPMTATFLPPAAHVAAASGDHPERLSSAGYVRPGMDVRIVDEAGLERPNGEVGEIVVQGPPVMRGYWRRDDATAEALRDGWLHTGDLGRMDEGGHLFILDRVKDMIITGGSNVYAVEVEKMLSDHDAVRDVAVVGSADRTWGEIVTAVVVTDLPPEEAERLLAGHCKARLASYKAPRRFVFVDELPRNAYGKVLKRELRQRLGS